MRGSPSQAILLTLGIVLVAVPPSAGEEGMRDVWIDGNHVVHGTEVHEDEILHVNGTFLVSPGSELILRHVNLIFEGNAPHSFGIQPGRGPDGQPVAPGKIRLESTERGSTIIQSSGDVRYFLSSFGWFEALGRPEAPVIIQNVTGSSANVAPDPRSSGSFLNGMQLVGGYNRLDHVVFLASGSGIGISSSGETRISNTTIALVNVPIYLLQAKNVLVENSFLSGYGAGFFANRAANVTVKNTTIQARDFGVIAFSTQLALADGAVKATDAAHFSKGGSYAVDNVSFSGYNQSGIHTHEDHEMSLVVRDSLFDGGGVAYTGIVAQNASSLRLERNTFQNHVGNGATVLNAKKVSLSDNLASHNGRLGVEIMDAVFEEEGSGADAQNALGVFSGSTLTRFVVLDEDGAPVVNATIRLTDEHGTNETLVTNETGGAAALLETLWIGNDQARVVNAYDLLAQAPGHPDASRAIRPYLDGQEIVLRLGVQGTQESQTYVSLPSVDLSRVALVALGLLGAALVVVLVVRRAKSR